MRLWLCSFLPFALASVFLPNSFAVTVCQFAYFLVTSLGEGRKTIVLPFVIRAWLPPFFTSRPLAFGAPDVGFAPGATALYFLYSFGG